MQNDVQGVYSPSDGSEGAILRDFVDEAIAHEHEPHEPISMPSPRTELLSSASNPGNDIANNDRNSRLRRGPTERYRRERESVYRNTSHNELLRHLIEQEYEGSKMRKTLYMAFAQLEGETQRANELEKQVQETVSRVTSMNQRALNAEAEVRSLREELNLYKIHYEVAQSRILKAQTVLATLRTQKEDAETMARKARGDARKVKEVLGVWKAREEGRKQGFEAGWRRARQEFGISTGAPILSLPYDSSEGPVIRPTREASPELDEDEFDDDDLSYMAPVTHDDLRIPDGPALHPPVHPPPVHPPPENRTESPSSHSISAVRHPDAAQSEPPPAAPSQLNPLSQAPPPRAPPAIGTRTPAMERFTINIPPADSEVVNQNINPPKPTRSNSLKKLAAPLVWRPGAHRDRPPSPHPPDNYIPSLTAEGTITLPPPHEMGGSYTPRSQMTDLSEPQHTRSVSLDGGLGTGRTANISGGRVPRLDAYYGDLDRGHPSSSTAPSTGAPTGGANANSSWYSGGRPASVQSQDYAYLEPVHARQPSVDSNHSASSNLSHMEILRGPDDAATPGQKHGNMLKNILRNPLKGKGKARQLSVINENPLSRQGSLNVHPQTQQTALAPSPSPSQIPQPSTGPQAYAQEARTFTPETRYSNFSGSEQSQPRRNEMRHDRPPRNVRLPAQLTVPAPLSPQNQRVSRTVSPEQVQQPRMRTASAGSMSSGFYQGPASQGRTPYPYIQGTHSPGNLDRTGRLGSNSMVGSSPPVGITIEPPSQTPSEQPAAVPSGGTSRLSLSADLQQPNANRFNSNAATSSPHYSPSLKSNRPGYPNPLPDDWVDTVPNTPESTRLTWPAPRPPSSNKGKGRADPYDQLSSASRPTSPFNAGNTQSHLRSSSRSGTPGISAAPGSSTGHSAGGATYPSNLDATVPVEGTSTLKRVPSNLSIRSGGSYSHFDPATYTDPALYGSEVDLNARPPSRPRSSSRASARPSIGLEYI
ncbi:hypothetical protein V5O48_006451 [Marasmius crinis-equi]|uniref:Uncharacterized protein n=1 Tax=Marasmius crinis-equi TaxID=585013 RepID=A0ABR3FJH8_9AGAR